MLRLHFKCGVFFDNIKIVNKSELSGLISFLFSVNFFKSLYSITVKSSKPKHLKLGILSKLSIHKLKNACRK